MHALRLLCSQLSLVHRNIRLHMGVSGARNVGKFDDIWFKVHALLNFQTKFPDVVATYEDSKSYAGLHIAFI